MIAIIDYDAGNIKSVEKAVNALGYQAEVTRDRETILQADRLPPVPALRFPAPHLHPLRSGN